MSTTPHAGVSNLDYESQQNQKKRPNWLLRIFLTLAVLVGAVSLILPNLCQSRETANRAKCQSNLHQIGLAISLYAQENAGHYPDTFATLMQNEQLTAAVFVCPSSNDEAADGDTPAAVLGNMAKPHHCSYLYLGTGMNAATVGDQTPIACEPPENHQSDGMNILFGDGHVEWEPATEAKKLLPKVFSSTQALRFSN
jgi:prepilin-type processing-associated H-X9-DG protein